MQVIEVPVTQPCTQVARKSVWHTRRLPSPPSPTIEKVHCQYSLARQFIELLQFIFSGYEKTHVHTRTTDDSYLLAHYLRVIVEGVVG